MATKKILYIIRHAKSSWDYDNISDIDRPLKLRGIRNAYEMARQLKINRNIPELFISSPANRALHTASIFINVLELKFAKLKVDSEFYGGGTDKILSIIKKQSDEVNKLAVFGHNPDFSYLAEKFTEAEYCQLPTCGMAIFSFNCESWKEISKSNLLDESLIFPAKE